MTKLEFLEMYLDLYLDHFTVLEAIKTKNSDYVILDIRNAPAHLKKDQIKGARALPVKDLANHLTALDKSKTYVVYDWNGGSILGKQALFLLLGAGFKAYELAGALEGWRAMHLPMEALSKD
ncbi:rhodanese-like domain-containing protein [Streptococcus macacae]|uniref:Rhodanese-like protein n=1 Tax=Streptococcus macacae NCTC 11558 TaxID=764298 RepID=G5JV29_9STRE|nr:rhodanese-like domain-containing protein [Streptococcus macacae]EHJ52256.1 rhodanese-like protein [Streptococcus macacae NCTC 11558]SUN79333.1 tRNA s(4)U8 sulfurtransferase [Streptococcus macacae NCTC 11558]